MPHQRSYSNISASEVNQQFYEHDDAGTPIQQNFIQSPNMNAADDLGEEDDSFYPSNFDSGNLAIEQSPTRVGHHQSIASASGHRNSANV